MNTKPLLQIEDESFKTLLGAASRGSKLSKQFLYVLQVSTNPEALNLLNILNSLIDHYNRVKFVAPVALAAE